MATWGAHLRIADKLIDTLDHDGFDKTAFVMGNIAPDSGIPCGGRYVPDKITSHYQTTCPDGTYMIDEGAFINRYLKSEQRKAYRPDEDAFYLGYLCHLLTDSVWLSFVHQPLKTQYLDEYQRDKHGLIEKWKEDFEGLDFLFLESHPDFRAFRLFREADGFQNRYLDFFSPDALDNRRVFIVSYYAHPEEDPHRSYRYLSEERMAQFIDFATSEILARIKTL